VLIALRNAHDEAQVALRESLSCRRTNSDDLLLRPMSGFHIDRARGEGGALEARPAARSTSRRCARSRLSAWRTSASSSASLKAWGPCCWRRASGRSEGGSSRIRSGGSTLIVRMDHPAARAVVGSIDFIGNSTERAAWRVGTGAASS
jgi:hypothetical protein